MKYNPGNIDLSKGKMKARVGYKKGTVMHDTDLLCDIIKNGGLVEVSAQQVNQSKDAEIQVIEFKVYFLSAT